MNARALISHCLAGISSFISSVNQRPVLVFGNAKSGTTIISYLLSEALQKSYTADIVRDIPDVSIPFQLEHKVVSIDYLVKKFTREFSKGVIKEPALTSYASEFISYFPGGKFVFIIRDPRDNIRSILNRLEMPGNLDNINLDDWPELTKTPAWKLVLDDTWKRNRCGGNYIDVMATNWMLAYEQYKLHSDHAFLIKYEDFCKDKSNTIYRLCKSVGLDAKKDISQLINIQKQSKGNSACDLEEFFGEKNLSRIESICEEGLFDMGYTALLRKQ